MPRRDEYTNSNISHSHFMESNQRGRIRDHFSLLQGGQRYSSQFGQRGFVSPRSVMRMSSNYDSVDDFSDTLSPMLPGGYIAPGTHSVPTSSGSSSSTFYRRPTPRPNNSTSRQTIGFGSHLGYHGHHPTHTYRNSHHSMGMGPIFPEEDEDTFFPPETLPPIQEVFSQYGSSGSGYSSSGFPEIEENRSREVFEERLASFPEVPLDAHRRIFLMGNEIVDCFEVRLDRFYRGSMLDSVPNCVAVFTKKERTGQRWLMVFKEDVTRTIVKFNRLLTHSLLVSVVSTTAIEVEAAKSLYGPPAEMCVINFANTEDASRFYKTLQEGQSTAWNHREVTHEQRMKNIFTKINVALAQADLLSSSVGIPSGSGRGADIIGGAGEIPSRSPFTFSLRNTRRDLSDLVHCSSNPPPGLTLRSRHPSETSSVHIADLDDDWRNRGRGAGDGREFRLDRPRSTSRQNQLPVKLTSSCGSVAGFTSSSNNHHLEVGGFSKSDGSGDNKEEVGGVKRSAHNVIMGDVIFQIFVTVFVKLDSVYAEFGSGTLQILDHQENALNELRLLDEDKSELLQQYIYKWNTALKKSDDAAKACICVWDGAVCLSLEPGAVPERRDFKIMLSSEEDADNFVQAFTKSAEKAKDESIRKRHIAWYLQNKRDYKTANTSPSTLQF